MTKKIPRGKALEKAVQRCNRTYRKKKLANIQKIETPIVPTSQGLIPQLSTVDFIGVLKGGKGIAFDAKETQNKTSLPLALLKQHQVEFLRLWDALGGAAFFLVHFYSLNETHAHKVPMELICKFWNSAYDDDGRKSIPTDEFKDEWLVPLTDYMELLT